MVQRGPTEFEHVQADISALVFPYPFLWYRVSCLALCLKASGKVTNLAWESVFPLLGESSEPVFACSLEEYSPDQGYPHSIPYYKMHAIPFPETNSQETTLEKLSEGIWYT